MRFAGLIPLTCSLSAAVSSTGPFYTVGFFDSNVYVVNPLTGAHSVVVTIGDPTEGVTDIVLADNTTAYVLTENTENVYRVNLQNNTYSLVTKTPLPAGLDPLSISLANPTTAYICEDNFDQIYSVNLESGQNRLIATVPGSPGLTDIVVANETLAYVCGSNDNNVYSVNLTTGATKLITPNPVGIGSVLFGITLANNTTAYVVGFNDNKVYRVDLLTGESFLVTPTPLSMSSDVSYLGLKDESTVYTVGFNSGQIYVVNLQDGSSDILTTLSANLNGAAFWLQMGTQNLRGNDLTTARYLNAHGPINVIRSLALLNNDFVEAIEAVAPTRNTFTTFATQISYVSAAQVLSDHCRQKRIPRKARAQPYTALLVAQNEESLSGLCIPEKNKKHTIWIAPFGEYAKVKAQKQTPEFSVKLGGLVGGIDWNSDCELVETVGFGAAYIFDHINESDHAGKANINQGYLTAYSAFRSGFWAIDLSLWGGYYASNNERNIRFTGVDETAKADIRGWQLAPHVECARTWGRNRLRVEPFVMLDWVANWERGFKEHGAGSFNMGQKKRFCSLLRSEIGLRFDERIEWSWGSLTLLEKGSYAYQKAFHTGSIQAFLVGSAGSFTVSTLTTAQNLGVAEFSMLFAPKSNASYLDIRFQGEFGSRYQSYQGTIEIGKNF